MKPEMPLREFSVRHPRAGRSMLPTIATAILLASIHLMTMEPDDAMAQAPPVSVPEPADGITVDIVSPSLFPTRFDVKACDTNSREKFTFTTEVTPAAAAMAAAEGVPFDEVGSNICFFQTIAVSTSSDADFSVTITATDQAAHSGKKKVDFKVTHLFIWKSATSLAWDDFTGNPPPKKVPEDPKDPASYDAATVSWIDWHRQTATKLQLEKESSKWNCVATWEVGARAAFRPSKSWVRPDKKSAELLDHEQGHFNITKTYADKLDAFLKKMVAGKEGKGSALDPKIAREKALADLYKLVSVKQLSDAVKKYETAEAAKQKEYDNETKHGTEAAEQKTWDDEIAKALSGAQSAKFPDP
jgi:hypothetical protein